MVTQTFSEPTRLMVSSSGVPKTSRMRLTYPLERAFCQRTYLIYIANVSFATVNGTHSFPLKMGLPPSSSARMQPIDHTSTECQSASVASTLTSSSIPAIREHDFWSPVPSRSHVCSQHYPTNCQRTFSQLHLLLSLLWRNFAIASCQTEIADLELAIRVDQQVSRFEITMDDVCRVDVLLVSQIMRMTCLHSA